MDPAVGVPLAKSNRLAPTDAKNAMTSHPDRGIARPTVTVEGTEQMFRFKGQDGGSFYDYLRPQIEVEKEDELLVTEIAERARRMYDPRVEIVCPSTSYRAYGTTAELFHRIEEKIRERVTLHPSTCALLTYWIFSTLFFDALPIAPALSIFGPPHEGDTILRTIDVTGTSAFELSGTLASLPK